MKAVTCIYFKGPWPQSNSQVKFMWTSVTLYIYNMLIYAL